MQLPGTGSNFTAKEHLMQFPLTSTTESPLSDISQIKDSWLRTAGVELGGCWGMVMCPYLLVSAVLPCIPPLRTKSVHLFCVVPKFDLSHYLFLLNLL